MTGILSPSVVPHDKYSDPYVPESLNLPLQRRPSEQPRVGLEPLSRVLKFTGLGNNAKCSSSLPGALSSNLQLLTISTNLNA